MAPVFPQAERRVKMNSSDRLTLKGKRAKQHEAAVYIVSLMRESLGQFTKDEQSHRIKEICKIGKMRSRLKFKQAEHP